MNLASINNENDVEKFFELSFVSTARRLDLKILMNLRMKLMSLRLEVLRLLYVMTEELIVSEYRDATSDANDYESCSMKNLTFQSKSDKS